MNAISPVALAASTTISSNPDLHLLLLGDRLAQAMRAEEAAWQQVTAEHYDDTPEFQFASIVADAVGEIVNQIIPEHANTLPGLLVKAKAACWCHPSGRWEATDLEPSRGVGGSPATSSLAIASLLNNLALLASQVLAIPDPPCINAAAATGEHRWSRDLFPSGHHPADAHPAGLAPDGAWPDAELLAACAEFDGWMRRYLATDFELASDETPQARAEAAKQEDYLEASAPSLDRICELRATTREGMAARAQSLTLWDQELMKPDRVYEADRLMQAIVRDLVGEAA